MPLKLLIFSSHVLGKSIRGWSMFLLFIVSLMYSCSGKKLFCVFIDYRQAFESVRRGLLLEKRLTDFGVNGKVPEPETTNCTGSS